MPDLTTENHTPTDLETTLNLPPYESPLAPLTSHHAYALSQLAQSARLRALNVHIKTAAEAVTDAAGEINERVTDAREKYMKQRRKKKNGNNEAGKDGDGDGDADGEGGNANGDDDDDDNDDEGENIRRKEAIVRSVTAGLDESMRCVVDTEVFVDGLVGVLSDLSKEHDPSSCNRNASTNNRRSRRTRGTTSDSENEDDDNDNQFESQEASAAVVGPSQTLTQKLSTEQKAWSEQSLTRRYAEHNSYVGFYRVLHNARFAGDEIPPVPHASTWFAYLEDPYRNSNSAITASSSSSTNANANANATTSTNSRKSRRTNNPSPSNSSDNDDDDDDVAIETERISLKCPLTLLPFNTPLTSNKCPHSFESDAILSMIHQSNLTIPALPRPGTGGRNMRVKVVKCPVCTVVLAEGDLRGDAALVRRVRRMREREKEREEAYDEEEEGGRKRKRKSGITVASDRESADEDEDEMESPIQIKRE